MAVETLEKPIDINVQTAERESGLSSEAKEKKEAFASMVSINCFQKAQDLLNQRPQSGTEASGGEVRRQGQNALAVMAIGEQIKEHTRTSSDSLEDMVIDIVPVEFGIPIPGNRDGDDSPASSQHVDITSTGIRTERFHIRPTDPALELSTVSEQSSIDHKDGRTVAIRKGPSIFSGFQLVEGSIVTYEDKEGKKIPQVTNTFYQLVGANAQVQIPVGEVSSAPARIAA